jgi:protein-arginine kinase activator protein McsA
MICPRCEQGEICQAQINATGKLVYVCQECEATWFSAEAIGVDAFIDFGTYMEKLGLPPLWSSLVLLPE